jgi:alkylhydroperoxidase family enzyme
MGRVKLPSATRYDQPIARLREAAPEREVPLEFALYLNKVRRHAYRVTDADIQRLLDAGFSEDEIFEHTVSAAVAAGLERLDAGLRVVR